MAREKRIKEIRKSYAIIGEGITEFFYFDGFRNVENLINPNILTTVIS